MRREATYAAVLSCPVDHRLVVGRIPFEHERAAEQGHLFIPGQGSSEAGCAPRPDCFLARQEASFSAVQVKRAILPASPV